MCVWSLGQPVPERETGSHTERTADRCRGGGWRAAPPRETRQRKPSDMEFKDGGKELTQGVLMFNLRNKIGLKKCQFFSIRLGKRLFLTLVFSEVQEDWHLLTVNKSKDFPFLELLFCYFKEERLVVFSYIPLYFGFGSSSFLSLSPPPLFLPVPSSPKQLSCLPSCHVTHSHLLSSFPPSDLLLPHSPLSTSVCICTGVHASACVYACVCMCVAIWI